jgi:hypothetical protein
VSAAHDGLVDALVLALAYCDETGDNLPEMLRAALEDVAHELGSVLRLIEHRPGSWEAQHVAALAAAEMTELDYQVGLW